MRTVCLLLLVSLGVSAQPVRLTCEYLTNPLGIGDPRPRLAWQLVSTEKNQVQSAYEISVTDDSKNTVWATGKVASSQSIQIEYAGKPLHPYTRYYWRVRVYDGSGKMSDWSETAHFETALPTVWPAQWIGDGSLQFTKDEEFYQPDPMPLFRKQMNFRKKISSARLYISGLGYYEASLNGIKIGNDVLAPAFTAYKKQVPYNVFDITSLLKTGNNTFGVMLGNGWWNALPLRLFGRFNFRDHQQTGRPCLCAEVLVRYSDGSEERIFTDTSWQTALGPILKNNVFLGEEYDARLEKSFDSSGGWNPARLAETTPTGTLVAQNQPPIRITKIIQPKAVREIGKDTFIVDMGQNFAGIVRMRVQGEAGKKIVFRYGEDVYPDGKLNWMTSTAGQIKEAWGISGGPGSPKTAWQRDTYTCKGGGQETFQPRFTFHGFRYVEIVGFKPNLSDIEGLRMNADLPIRGEFSCSNAMFNRLHEVIQWTFLSNVFSVQSDCPAREKMGYGGDLVATADAFSYNYDMAQFYTKTVDDFANDQQPDGGITEIAPYTGIADRGYGGESGPLGWQLAFAFLQKKLYEFYGDKRVIERMYPRFQQQMAFLEAKAFQGLFHWDIGDHEALDPRPEAFSAACFYYHHALLATEFAEILNKPEDINRYKKLAEGIRERIIRKYEVPKTGRFDNATQSAQIFALWYNLAPKNGLVMQRLLDEYSRHNGHLSTGIFATKMGFDVLREANNNALAYSVANKRTFPSWGYMLDNGATTLWESWAYPDATPSQNHPMFGSVDEWFYRALLGINADEAGFKKIIIKPQPVGDLTFAKGSYESPYGKISSDWTLSNGVFSLTTELPPNTTAEVWLPATEAKESGGLSPARQETGYAVFNVGSGTWHFTAKLP